MIFTVFFSLFWDPSFHGDHLPMGRRRVVSAQVKKAAAAAAAENITMAEVTWCGLRAGAYGEKGMRRQMEDETVTEPENQIYGMIK